MGVARPARAFDAERASFALEVQGEYCPYRVFAFYVLPEELVSIRVIEGVEGSYRLEATAGERVAWGSSRWQWRAPARPGLYPVEVVRLDRNEVLRLNVFVMIPRSEMRDGTLRGYRIGAYPSTPLRGLAIYLPPRGFVEVTQENLDTPLSPHFTLGQFVCKQAGGFPKMVVLRERLLLKLEYLLQVVNTRGWHTESFFVMSGYRTPLYNRAIGNVRYSRHQWGGAVDIFIDENPRDGVMDDLDRNGTIDRRDALVLYEMVEGLAGHREYGPYVGGLGDYGKSLTHGPFVHVDVRGFKARWKG